MLILTLSALASCMQAEEISLDTPGTRGLLLGSLSLEDGLFSGNDLCAFRSGRIMYGNGDRHELVYCAGCLPGTQHRGTRRANGLEASDG